jgi:plasmid stabilization system protein ParE
VPSAWSKKDERKYEKIEKAQRKRGTSAKRAREIAARTVNKQRREGGRTANRTTRGTGNPNRSLADRSVAELKNRARELDIEGRSKMNKAELVRAIRRRE